MACVGHLGLAFFFLVEAGVFEQQDLARLQRLGHGHRASAPMQSGANFTGLPSSSWQAGGHRLEAELRPRSPCPWAGPGGSSAPAMRPAPAVLDRRQRRRDAGVVGDLAVLDRHVEIHAHQHAPALEIHVANRLLVHRSSSNSISGQRYGASALTRCRRGRIRAPRADATLLRGRHVDDQVHELVGIAPLVVVPGHDLDEVGVQHDAGARVEDRRARVVDEVGGNHLFLGVAQDALQLALGGGLHRGLDRVVGGLGVRARRLLQAAGQVHHRHIQGRHAERHARQLALQRRDDLAHGLGGAGGGRDDVAGRRAAAAPVLLATGRPRSSAWPWWRARWSSALRRCPSCRSAPWPRRQAVGRAGGAGNDLLALVALVVDAHDEHRGVVLGRRRHNVLRAGLEVPFGLALSRNKPVDSKMYSAPTSPHFNCASSGISQSSPLLQAQGFF